jgi:hypothetical protein
LPQPLFRDYANGTTPAPRETMRLSFSLFAALFALGWLAPSAWAQDDATLAGGPEPSSEPAQPSVPPPVHAVVGCTAPCFRMPRNQDDFGTFGVRVSETQVRTDVDTTTSVGVSAAFDHHQYITTGLLTTRSLVFGFIGGGSGGFEGGLGGDLAIGARAPTGPDQGPFIRFGFRGYLFGNDDLYNSLLELPTGQVGYQLLVRHRLLFEIAASGAPVLVGRYNVDDAAPRKLGKSFEWGGHLGARVGGVHLELGYWRFEPQRNSPYDALNMLNGQLCAAAWPIALCADARYYRGQVWTPLAGGSTLDLSQSYYLGLHFGFLAEPHDVGRDRRERRREWREAPPPEPAP